MKNTTIIILAVLLALFGIGLFVGVPIMGYLLVVKAGGPEYVGVLAALALLMFMFAGLRVKK